MCKTSGSTDPTDLASLGEEEEDGSVKLKKHFSWWEPERNENDYRDSSPGPEKKCDRYRTGQCPAVDEDPESSPDGTLWRKRDRRVEPRCGAGCLRSPRKRQ